MSARKRPIRLGLVGAGNVVETYHLPVLRGMREFKIAWILDKDVHRARALAATFAIPHAVGSLAECADVDMVLVAIPVGARRAVLEQILARGWHAFCEKPFAATLREHQWLVEEARRHQVRLGIGLMRRHYASTQTARRLLDARLLGRVELILGGDGMPLQRTGRGAEWYQGSALASGGGALMETGPHLIDQTFTLCSVEGYQIERCAQKAWESLEFETSVQGKVTLGCGRRVPFAFVVSRLRDAYNGIVVRCENGELRVGTAPDGVVEICARDGTSVGRVGSSPPRPRALYDAIRSEWQTFVEKCAHSAEFTDWDTGLLTTAFLEECYQFQAPAAAGSALEISR